VINKKTRAQARASARSDQEWNNSQPLLTPPPLNPYFFRGTAGEGIGGPHVGPDMIWPMAIIVRALTSTDEAEILRCLRTLRSSHAGTGFMHESYHKEDPTRFTRSWFAWANALFGELILRLSEERPHVLTRPLA